MEDSQSVDMIHCAWVTWNEADREPENRAIAHACKLLRPLTFIHGCRRGEEFFLLFPRWLPTQLGSEGGHEGDALTADVIPHSRVAYMRQWDREKGGGGGYGEGRERVRKGGREGWSEKIEREGVCICTTKLCLWKTVLQYQILYLTSLIQTVHLPPSMSRVDGQLVEVQVTKVLGKEETVKMSSKSEHD